MLQTNLAHFEADPASFLERFLTQDKCWVHHFEPETRRQSMKWKSAMGNTMPTCWGSYTKGNQVKTAWKTDEETVLFYQDNALARMSVVAMAAVLWH